MPLGRQQQQQHGVAAQQGALHCHCARIRAPLLPRPAAAPSPPRLGHLQTGAPTGRPGVARRCGCMWFLAPALSPTTYKLDGQSGRPRPSKLCCPRLSALVRTCPAAAPRGGRRACGRVCLWGRGCTAHGVQIHYYYCLSRARGGRCWWAAAACGPACTHNGVEWRPWHGTVPRWGVMMPSSPSAG